MTDKKITYFLGAGASFNAIPIWSKQATSMVGIANRVLERLSNSRYSKVNMGIFDKSSDKAKIEIIFKDLKRFGELAKEYGSIDIYARRLSLLKQKTELNNLKFCLSVYFDIWENQLVGINYKNGPWKVDKEMELFDKIDKRFYSLLSVLLEGHESFPKLNDNISFITWNYDLQLERAYESFLKGKTPSLEILNETFGFYDAKDNSEKRKVIHLNGFRGMFNSEGEAFETVDYNNSQNIFDYLKVLVQNENGFRKSSMDYHDFIKYAWESNSSSIELAKKKMSESDILVIIGYSFPPFNRVIDEILIKEFEDGGVERKVIYQDPNANEDVINSLFRDPRIVQFEKKNINQFYIPSELFFNKESPYFFF